LEALERSAAATLVIYDKLVRMIEKWIAERGEKISSVDGLKALALLGPALELRGKIIDQRGAEAQDVTQKMRQNLEPFHERERIAETLELMRERFRDNVKARN
jgi:hypothetical protein